MRCEIPVQVTGVHHLAIVTMLDYRAVIGATRIIDVLEGFRGLHACRAGDNIQLTWAWPTSSPVTVATVRWECTGDEAGSGLIPKVSATATTAGVFLSAPSDAGTGSLSHR